MNRLEARGLVARQHDPHVTDRRAVLVAVTDDGARLVRQLGDRLVARLAELDGFARSGLKFVHGLVGAMLSGRDHDLGQPPDSGRG